MGQAWVSAWRRGWLSQTEWGKCEVTWCTDSSVAAKHVMDNLAFTHLSLYSLLSFLSSSPSITHSPVFHETQSDSRWAGLACGVRVVAEHTHLPLAQHHRGSQSRT